MNLAQTQRLFWRAARRQADPGAIRACFVGDSQLTAEHRMQVYAGAFFARQLKCLRVFFPKTRSWIGERFTELGRQYIVEYPGTRAALETFPERFPSFLESIGGLDEAAELSLLELSQARVLIAPQGGAPLTLNRMKTLAAHDRIGIQSGLEMHSVSAAAAQHFGEPTEVGAGSLGGSSSYEGIPPLAEDTFSRDLDGTTSASAATSRHVAPRSPGERAQQGVTLLLHRKGNAVSRRTLRDDEARAIERLRSAPTLAELCECFLDHSDPLRRAHVVLSRLLVDKLLVEATSPSSP